MDKGGSPLSSSAKNMLIVYKSCRKTCKPKSVYNTILLVISVQQMCKIQVGPVQGETKMSKTTLEFNIF